jgi:nicotinate-nucleotide--dimethylbenzimidazole phosphoribosyltransferase
MDELLAQLPGPDSEAAAAVADRAAAVIRPTAALARLDEVASWLAGWQRTACPHVDAPAVIVFVADHGVAAEEVSAYPATVTAEMLRALTSGAATANAMARAIGATLKVVDVGVGDPTGNLMHEAALSDERLGACLEAGRRAVASVDTDLLVLGEMGIGNTTPAAAVCAALYGEGAEVWTGRGTGVDDAALERKVKVVDAAVRRIAQVRDPIEILREVGGSELAAIAGAIVEARRRSVPVVLDGFVVCAAAAALQQSRAGALDHCWAGHRSAEAGHRRLLEKLGKRPLLDLDMRLGEGSGALAAVPIVKLAAACVTDVATFDEWGL